MKFTFCFALLTSLALLSNAQQGNNQVQVAAEVGIPTGDFGDLVNTGFGGSVKGLLGVGSAGQVSLTSGYTSYKIKDLSSSHVSIIPILAGYRHIFNGFYIEPQVGVGIYGYKTKIDTETFSDSKAAFTWGGGIGYDFKGLDIGVRYQSGKEKDASSPYSLIGIHVGYNISLGGSKQ